MGLNTNARFFFITESDTLDILNEQIHDVEKDFVCDGSMTGLLLSLTNITT